MPRIGVTGHRDLAPDSVPLVRAALRALLRPRAAEGLVGVSCAAQGADTEFGEVVLELGGTLEVLLPANDYRAGESGREAERFQGLLRRASLLRVLPCEACGPDAYAAANEVLLATVDTLVAVWDGRPAAGRGGTGDAVARACALGREVLVVWPRGAARMGVPSSA